MGRTFVIDVGNMTRADAIRFIRQVGEWARLGGWRYSITMIALFHLEERIAEFDSRLNAVVAQR